MQYIRILQSELDRWTQRLENASHTHFGSQVKYFLTWLENSVLLKSSLLQLIQTHSYDQAQLAVFENELQLRNQLVFANEDCEAAFAVQYLTFLVDNVGYDKLNALISFQGKDSMETHRKFSERLLKPQINYLNNVLARNGFVIYLLERYKSRCEWFTKKELIKDYQTLQSNYEQLFEDDLRKYLFDQGIDYPFSTPKSPSGRTDIVGNLNTDDPVVVEIKIFDRSKGYSKHRIKSGLSQILRYTNDYNKMIGYLVIFNVDNIELNFNFSNSTIEPFPNIRFNNKLYYFITINLGIETSASKIGKTDSIEILEDDLI